MRRDNVGEEQVVLAIDSLLGEGVRPTQKGIHDLVGGSYSTIGPVLRKWKADQKVVAVKPPVELPESMREAIDRAVGELWTTANNLANDKVAAIEAQAEASVREAQQEATEAGEVITDLERELEQADARLQAKQSAHEVVVKAEREAERRAVVAETRVDELERQIADLRKQVEGVVDIREKLAASKAQVDELRRQIDQRVDA